ncbi:MAG: N-acetyltransferase [Methanobacteriota archaeon]
MSGFTVRKALPSDAERIHELVYVYSRRDEMLPLPFSEVYERIRDFFVAEEDGKVIGCCALRVSWIDLAEVRSLAVDEAHLKKGVGARLIEECVKDAKSLGVKRVFTLTNKPDFFKKLWFSKTSKNELPMKVWGECVKCCKFANCDEQAMVRKLD